MDVRQLYYFLALCQQEHMSSTAELLGISQPALSKSIANLEKETGARLFDRHGNSIQLNDYGRSFSVYAQKALQELETGLSILRQDQYDTCGEIRISCFAFADLLSDCLLAYTSLNPKIKITISQRSHNSDDLIPDMDFILISQNDTILFNDRQHTWLPLRLCSEQSHILISPRYREYPPGVTELAMEDLKDDYFITFPISSLFYTDVTQKLCNAAGFSPKIFCSTDSFLTKMRFVDAGKAICILPECNLRMARQISPDIRTFRIRDRDTSRTLYLMCRQNALTSEAAADFWAFVQDYYKAG